MSEVRNAACAVLLRRTKSGSRRSGPASQPFETYLVRRDPHLEFLGGFDVFPGGTTDPVDAEVPVTGGITGDAAITRATAVRELFEETGVLALPGAAQVPREERDELRRALCAGGVDAALRWRDTLRRYDLKIDGPAMIPLGVWVTPPYVPRVYRAPYYAVWLPEDEEPEVWPGELTAGTWWSADDAVAAHHEGRLFISYPVLETLDVMRRQGLDIDAAARELQARNGSHPHGGGELLRGVHVCPVRTFTLPPATHTNCYLLGGAEMVIVDPASPIEAEQDRLLSYVRHLEGRGARIVEIWLTHQHKDHIGGVERLRDELRVPVAAHRLTADALRGDIDVDRTMEDGEVRELAIEVGPPQFWQALHTPGHARGHLCFYEQRSRTLLSGDNVLGIGTVLISPPEGNMLAYMNTLRRLRELELGFLLPAHGPPIAAAREKIDFYLAHRVAREEKILAALDDSGRAAREIVPEVYVEVDPRVFPLAEINVQAHLEKLVFERRARAVEGGRFARVRDSASAPRR